MDTVQDKLHIRTLLIRIWQSWANEDEHGYRVNQRQLDDLGWRVGLKSDWELTEEQRKGMRRKT